MESLYDGVCNVTEYGEVFDSATKKQNMKNGSFRKSKLQTVI